MMDSQYPPLPRVPEDTPAHREFIPTGVVIHYHEVALKGHNRPFFERQLQRNVYRVTARHGVTGVERLSGRLMAKLAPEADWPAIAAALQQVFGIAYFAPVLKLHQNLAELSAAAIRVLAGRQFASFKIDTRRAQKHFHLTSPQINAHVGELVRQHYGVRVSLDAPEATVWIEIVDNYALLYAERIPGPGGLPVGTGERAVCLISGGIDSPVAAYRMLKRGVRLVYVHFHSAPFTSTASQELVIRLVEKLARHQFQTRLYLVPFAEIQQQIVAQCPPGLRIIFYRREMLRLAERLAEKHDAPALVTGDNVSQVASQTLSNLRVISEATTLPVLRPLAGDDKQDIVAQARQIGTFALSTEPFEDCCSLFVPPNPETRAKLERVKWHEARLELEALRRQALDGAVVKIFKQRAHAPAE